MDKWQELYWKLPQVPVGAPHDAKSIDVIVPSEGHVSVHKVRAPLSTAVQHTVDRMFGWLGRIVGCVVGCPVGTDGCVVGCPVGCDGCVVGCPVGCDGCVVGCPVGCLGQTSGVVEVINAMELSNDCERSVPPL